jgi:hypothetical protein
MKSIIDLGSELLFDRSRVAFPYLRLLVSALGRELAPCSPWVSVHKCALAVYVIAPELIAIDAQQHGRPNRKSPDVSCIKDRRLGACASTRRR